MLLALAAVTAILVVGTGAATADPSISSKQAQAEAIMAQIQELDSGLSHAIESYNFATYELGEIDADLESNGRHLVVARQSLGAAQQHIAQRLRALYINGDGGGAFEIILGARSLDDLLDRLDIAERVGVQDAVVMRKVKRFRKEVQLRRERLRTARERQAEIVSQRAAQKRSIEGRLAERQRLLASVKDEIARLQEAERRRQALLEAQLRARIAAASRSASQPRTLEVGSAYGTDPATAGSALPSLSAPPAKYGGVVGIAMQYLGVPYVWGGMSPSGFDCSGLISYVYAQVGVSLPHHAASQFNHGTPVGRSELQPGDLVFFDGLGHAGIYVGGGSFIHAPHTGDVVKISSLDDSWYASKWVGGRRIT